MAKREELTLSQKDALKQMPDKGWFTKDDVILISRPHFNIDVLFKKGYLKRRFILAENSTVFFAHLNGHFEYKKINKRKTKC